MNNKLITKPFNDPNLLLSKKFVISDADGNFIDTFVRQHVPSENKKVQSSFSYFFNSVHGMKKSIILSGTVSLPFNFSIFCLRFDIALEKNESEGFCFTILVDFTENSLFRVLFVFKWYSMNELFFLF